MELGGNAPFLVFADADVDAAVEGAVIAKMRNIGEACTAANRFHVAEPARRTSSPRSWPAKLGAMKVGRGTEEDVKVGPLIDATQRDKVDELVRDALGKGAQAVVGGTARDGAGYFYEPTVLGGVRGDARLLKEEIFGPVAPVIGFDDEEAAIAAANDTEFGLVAYVYTSDVKRAFRVCEGLETGMVGLNQGLVSNPAAPFGGVKASGFGREGGRGGDRGVPGDQVRRDGDVSDSARRSVRGAGTRDGASRPGVHEPEAAALATATPDGRAVGADRAAARDRRRGRRLLHEPREPQGARAGGEPARARSRSTGRRWSARCGSRGRSSALTDAESDAYFAGRPHGSRLGAWASHAGRA